MGWQTLAVRISLSLVKGLAILNIFFKSQVEGKCCLERLNAWVFLQFFLLFANCFCSSLPHIQSSVNQNHNLSHTPSAPPNCFSYHLLASFNSKEFLCFSFQENSASALKVNGLSVASPFACAHGSLIRSQDQATFKPTNHN